MANIKLKELLEASIDPKLVARSKESGKLVYFKSPEAKAKALKAGSHEEPNDSKSTQSVKTTEKPAGADLFGKDYQSQRGGGNVKPTSNINPSNWKWSGDEYDYDMSSEAEDEARKYLNNALGIKGGFTDISSGTGAIQYSMGGDEPVNFIFIGRDPNNAKKFIVTIEGEDFGEDFDWQENWKTFGNPEAALKYAAALGNKYKKELSK